MKDREFKGPAAGTLKAAMLVVGLLGLIFCAVGSVQAQEVTGITNSPSGQSVTAYLDYREVNYSFINWGLTLVAKSPAFKKEPVLSGSKVIRGTLQLGGSKSDEMGFAWDRRAGKLYLDLNRNLDLTDDPTGVFSCGRGFNDNYQFFTNVRLPFKTQAGTRPMLADLSFNDYGRLSCSAAMRSLWQGKVTLQGEEWEVGLLANPLDQRASLESGSLLLRPWGDRNKPFSLYGGALDAVPFSHNLFVGNRAYELRCTNEVQGDVVKVQMQFTEQQPKLGELKITGDYVQRATLEGGPYLVVLDKPAGMVKVPVGRYGQAKVCLKKGDAQAYFLDGRTQWAAGHITVSEAAPAILRVGGPLTNSVSVSRQGRKLALNYQLVGAGGAYQMVSQDRSHAPEFAVYQGDKKVGSGKFEFG
jgi:hypothetical protein